jgi:hypothetical protein
MGTRQEAADESKEALLQAGEDLIQDLIRSGRVDPLRLVSPTEVAQRARRSKALLYHFWPVEPSSDDKLSGYRTDLLLRVLRRPYDPTGITEVAVSAVSDGLPEVVRRVGNFEFARFAPLGVFARAHRFSVILAAASELRSETEPTSSQLPWELDEGPYRELSDLYAAMLDLFGLKLRPPMQIENLVVILSALVEGCALEAWYAGSLLTDPIAWPEEGSKGTWTPFAIAVLAIIEKVTEPRACDNPLCEENCVVLVTSPGSDQRVALCSRHLWIRLATEDEPVELAVVHREPDPEVLAALFPDSDRAVAQARRRWNDAKNAR